MSSNTKCMSRIRTEMPNVQTRLTSCKHILMYLQPQIGFKLSTILLMFGVFKSSVTPYEKN